MRRLLLAGGACAALIPFPTAASAASGPESPTATHANPSSCQGAERATRNSVGGDREHGGLGPPQRVMVKTYAPYGQWLQGWKAEYCEYPPGGAAAGTATPDGTAAPAAPAASSDAAAPAAATRPATRKGRAHRRAHGRRGAGHHRRR